MMQGMINGENVSGYKMNRGYGVIENKYHKNLGDENLARLFVNYNDDEAFNELVNRYAGMIYRLALRITKDTYSAEDVLQNVFLILIEKLQNFKGESKLSTWIYTITSNESLLTLRKNVFRSSKETSYDKHREELSNYDSGLYDSGGPLPDKLVMNMEVNTILERVINELPDDYRIAFQLRDIEGLSNREAADILGISVPAIKSRILRARNELRRKLIPYLSLNSYDFKQNLS